MGKFLGWICLSFLMVDKGILLKKEGRWLVLMNPTSLQRFSITVDKNEKLQEMIKKDMQGLYRIFSVELEDDCKQQFYCSGVIKDYSKALGPHEL